MIRWIWLLFFTVDVFAQEKPIALIGTILMSNKSIDNGTLLIVNGRIAAVGISVSIPNDTIVIRTNGVISSGLIDVHNHLTWNIFPRWKPIEESGNRYDWRKKPVIRSSMNSSYEALVKAGLSCAMQRYAEVKAITQGETSVIGSLLESCNHGLARNLDDDPMLGKIGYNIFPLETTEAEIEEAKKSLSSNGTLFVHIAEGSSNDAASTREFSMLKSRGLLVPGVSLIHAVALGENDFSEMAKAGVGLVWSPRSNIELYGETVNIKAAKENHVITALAPDWSITGSDGLISELNYAATWNTGLEQPLFDDRSLLEMATINAAKLARLDNRLGVLQKGFLADVLVLRSQHNQSQHDGYWTVTHATPEDVLLVMIDGKAVYGDPAVMKQLTKADTLESLDICGTKKSISFASQVGLQPTFKQTQAILNRALRQWSHTLAPLSECGA
jgi:5-methylthioadenosine/S-adenosylhomocysteine deaminase